MSRPSGLTHEGTKPTKDARSGLVQRYREPAAKAKADAVSREIIGAAIEVHRQLGPGLLESVYQRCLARELEIRGVAHQQELPIPVTYKGLVLEASHRLDLLVDDLVIVELKSVERLETVHHLQLLSYLRLSGRWLGLVRGAVEAVGRIR